MPNIAIDHNGIVEILESINLSKSTGCGLIPARLLKEAVPALAPFLTFIFQQSIDTGTVPREKVTANITAIYKKGSKLDVANYRPVLLTSIQGGVLGISSDGDDRMEPKFKTQKNP